MRAFAKLLMFFAALLLLAQLATTGHAMLSMLLAAISAVLFLAYVAVRLVPF